MAFCTQILHSIIQWLIIIRFQLTVARYLDGRMATVLWHSFDVAPAARDALAWRPPHFIGCCGASAHAAWATAPPVFSAISVLKLAGWKWK